MAANCSGVAFIKRNSRSVGIAALIISSMAQSQFREGKKVRVASSARWPVRLAPPAAACGFALLTDLRILQNDGQKNCAPFAERFNHGQNSARVPGFRFFILHSSFSLRFVMSYFSNAVQRCAERRQLNQSDLSKRSGVSNSHISRLYSGESRDLSDANFAGLLSAFATDPAAQAEIIAARCMDVREIARFAKAPGADLVEIATRQPQRAAAENAKSSKLPMVELSHETERAFEWLRSQCPLNPDLEKHLVGYAKLTGMK